MEAHLNAYVLTDDAVRDLMALEDYMFTYSDESHVESVENAFFEVFELLRESAFRHPIYRFESSLSLLHEYRSVNVYHYKVFYWIRGDTVVIYRIRHLASDFTRMTW